MPVPQGERSYSMPGQRTKLRLSAVGVGRKKLDVVDLGTVFAGDAVADKALRTPAEKSVSCSKLSSSRFERVLADQKKPVAAVGDIAVTVPHRRLRPRHPWRVDSSGHL